MANLFYGQISTNNEFASLESLTNLNLTADTTYIIENRSGRKLLVCESDNKPTVDSGFTVANGERLVYTKGDYTLYIKTKGTVINVAE